jgi:hypothetical protein
MPGDTASDNTGGRNGLSTKHLLSAMEKPGVQVEDAFKQAAEKVYLASNKRQDPWMEGHIRGQFSFTLLLAPKLQLGCTILEAPASHKGSPYLVHSSILQPMLLQSTGISLIQHPSGIETGAS